jgi:molybdopterin converting factor small subunit
MKLRLILSGRGYDRSCGVPNEMTLPDGSTLDDALVALRRLMPDDGELPASCLIAVSGVHLGTLGSHAPRTLKDGDELVVIAPVAGG